jgi:hypothetical protein
MADKVPYYDYGGALELAGATVHHYKAFGDYQGIWLAKVTFNDAVVWLRDYYGSCSGCDALEDANHPYRYGDDSDEEWAAKVAAYEAKVRKVGEDCLMRAMSLEELRAELGPEPYGDDLEAFEWLKTVEGE